jgi:hypothetical protein
MLHVSPTRRGVIELDAKARCANLRLAFASEPTQLLGTPHPAPLTSSSSSKGARKARVGRRSMRSEYRVAKVMYCRAQMTSGSRLAGDTTQHGSKVETVNESTNNRPMRMIEHH